MRAKTILLMMIMKIWARINNAMGDKSSPPGEGRIRRKGASNGSVKIRRTGMMVAMGLTQDRMAWASVNKMTRSSVQVDNVIMATPTVEGNIAAGRIAL